MAMFVARTLRITLFLLHSVGLTNAGRHVYSDSFATSTEEFDPTILDPHHIYGSPYGGFSRATRSRLASLPLFLPEVSVETPATDDNAIYFEVSDSTGRLFACRVYHEDELLPESLGESMFDAPKLRATVENSVGIGNDNDKITEHLVTSQARSNLHLNEAVVTASLQVPKPETKSFLQSPSGSNHGISDRPAGSRTASFSEYADGEVANEENTHHPAHKSDVDEGLKDAKEQKADALFVIESRLAELKSICGQMHKGWWSYEWCFEQTISQFHIEYDQVQNLIEVDSVTDLGKFKSRSVFLGPENMTPNEWAEDTPEIARVLDIHDGGAICQETGHSRKTNVHIQCCAEKIAKTGKGMLHREGHQIASTVAVLHDVFEDPANVCTYNVTVCTPLLCGSLDDDNDNDSTAISSLTMASTESGLEPSSVIKENESIREILDRVLSNLCVQSNVGGWWTYEFCHKLVIRQYHEVAGVQRNSAGTKLASKVVEAEHILGKYDAAIADAISDQEEWKLVVNVTTGGSTWGEGNGAYYEVEYTGGDVCDHSDVTDSAIVAGTASAGGGVERASTVRFFCGQAYDVSVNEDSTCHYVVHIKVPPLCKHPLFRAPIVKKQVMKCLPTVD